MTADERKEAYDALEVAILKLVALQDQQSEIPADAVLIIGTQFFDEDGDRSGCVQIHPRGGWQPPYATAGLLAIAQAIVTAPPPQSEDDN